MVYNGTPYYYVLNQQGDVIRVVSADGTTYASYVYDAWGRLVGSSGSMQSINPIRYRGYYYDNDIKMYYLGSRFYDPALKRFINADSYVSTGQGLLGYNMFAYCSNNPVMHKDAFGDLYERAAGGGGGGFTYIPRCGNSGTIADKVLTTGAISAAVAKIAGDALSTDAMRKEMVAIRRTSNSNTKRNNSVYYLQDSAGTVQYVGRTNNVPRREAAHKANPARAGLHMEVVASGLSLEEARALEQAGMAYHHTINTANRMNNQINGVAPKYWGAFKECALGVLDYGWNQMTNEILYWAGS